MKNVLKLLVRVRQKKGGVRLSLSIMVLSAMVCVHTPVAQTDTGHRYAKANGSRMKTRVGEGSYGRQAQQILRSSGIKGGIIVHLGCGDGELTAALHGGDQFIVRGVDTDAKAVENARRNIDSRGVYGEVCAEVYDGRHLPYGDNMVNLIVAADTADVSREEINRVLVPRGVLLAQAETKFSNSPGLKRAGKFGQWRKYVRPWPDDIDQWTHFLHDSSGNAVSADKRVRYPKHIQWRSGPRFSRHHDALASLSAMTSSNGRVFYIYDEGCISIVHRPPDWNLIARDAFNGKLLWKRDIPNWMTHLYNFRAGPTQLARRLVSVGDYVYCTLGWTAPAVKLDAADGRTLVTYQGSEGTEELVYHDGMLLAVIGHPQRHIRASDGAVGYWDRLERDAAVREKRIIAYDAEDGDIRWQLKGDSLGHLAPLSLCALGNNVFYLDNKKLHCIDADTGTERWASSFTSPGPGLFIRGYAPTVVAHDDVIMCMVWDRLCAYSIETGRRLWKRKGAIGFASPADLFAISDTAWTFPMLRGAQFPPRSGFINRGKTGVGIDIHSGEIVKKVPFARTQHHHRCYRNKATRDYILLGHSGIQVVDPETEELTTHRWVRGICQYGIMPANGYIYVPPHPCRCYFTGKINGFFALSDTSSWADLRVSSSLQKGPAYEATQTGQSQPANADGNDNQWPTYRSDNARSGSVSCHLPNKPAVKWRTEINDGTTAPVVAGGKVYVADENGCAVHCLNAETGKRLWKYLACGRVDSPPSIYRGLCVFGCLDGSVYCLNADSGRLAWRFKTSAIERRIGRDNRLASPLAVHGSVLIIDGTVYFAAGYSSNLDRGIRLYGLDVRTGEQLHYNKLASGHRGDDGRWGFLADILTASRDGKRITMRGIGFDIGLKRTGHGSTFRRATGLLDASWFHRARWKAPGGKGKLAAFSDSRTVLVNNPYTGLKQRRKVTTTSQEGSKYNQVGHFHQKFARYLKKEWFPIGNRLSVKGTGGADDWEKHVELQIRALLLGASKVFAAGWRDEMAVKLKTGRPRDPAHPDPRNGVLRLYSAADGEQICQLNLPAPPVFDGLAAADGGVLASLKDGSVICIQDE